MGHGNICKFAEICLAKTREITSSKLIFLAAFSCPEPLCVRAAGPRHFSATASCMPRLPMLSAPRQRLVPVTPRRRRSALLQRLDLQFNGVWRRQTPFKTPRGDSSWALCRLPMTDNAQKLNPSSLSDCRFPSVHFCVVVQGVAVLFFLLPNTYNYLLYI